MFDIIVLQQVLPEVRQPVIDSKVFAIDGDSDHLLGLVPKILAEPVEFKLVGNEGVVAACPERVDTMKEVLVINLAASL